jgi:DUF1365 family protein
MPRPLNPKSDHAVALYFGDVMHARLKPITAGGVGHRFSYRVMNLLIDLDRLSEANRLSPLFRVNRRGIFSFHERDHGPRDGSSLHAYASSRAAEAGVDLTGGHVLLLCYPRILGYVFNPLSVYYGHDRDGRIAVLIYEVRNTFGEMHTYVCPVTADEVTPAGIRQQRDKAFYVSPFIPMEMRYHFRLTPPGEDLKLRILETDAEGPLLAATFCGVRRILTSHRLLTALLALPFMTLKVIGGIHFEAFRLWLKGARLQQRPQPSQPAMAADGRPRGPGQASPGMAAPGTSA